MTDHEKEAEAWANSQAPFIKRVQISTYTSNQIAQEAYLAGLHGPSVTKLVEALRQATVELGWLIQQTKSRPGGSVDSAYQSGCQALAEFQKGRGE